MKFSRLLPVPIRRSLKRRALGPFLMSIKPHAKVLDVGCGNDSPLTCKRIRPDIDYIGLDIKNSNQSDFSISTADEYILVDVQDFAGAIEKYQRQLDAVISSHNLEHCNKPDDVLEAMAKSLKASGKLYLSFPSEKSVTFPSRKGTLNFYDDKTHQTVPEFKKIISSLQAYGLEIEYASQRYRPVLFFSIGLLFEPISRLLNRMVPYGATWAFYGFESIIWAKRPPLS